MESNKQLQKAGNNSQQLQFVDSTINVGITEKRAREIFSEMNAIARQSYTQDAYELAIKRVEMFEELLMNKVEQVDGMLEAFRDPSFQFLLIEAQKRAAASDRESDFEMLTELLAHRIEKNDDRKIKASISKAVEIVDQIDDDALCGLTMVYVISNWGTVAGSILQGIEDMNEMFSSLCYRELPTGFDWVDHLDILDAVRISSIGTFGTFKKFDEFYPSRFNGYTCVGIQKDSENYTKALEILNELQIPKNILGPHELNDGYIRLFVGSQKSITNINIGYMEQGKFVFERKITPQEAESLNNIWKLYSTDSKLAEQVKHTFMEKWDSYNTLHLIRMWWESLPYSFAITPIGEVLAHVNAQRYYPKIPNLNM